jgi:hypothetical protein
LGKIVENDHIWDNFGQFSGILCGGFVFGAVSWCAYIQNIGHGYNALDHGITRHQFYIASALKFRYFSVFSIFYPIHVLCDTLAKCLLLCRMCDHCSHSYYNQARDMEQGRMSGDGRWDFRDCIGQYTLYNSVRRIKVVALVLCVLNIATRVALAGLHAHVSIAFDEAAASCDSEGRDTHTSSQLQADINALLFDGADKLISVSRVIEAAVLVLMFTAYLLCFPPCVMMFWRVQRRISDIIGEMHHRPDEVTVLLPFEFSDQDAVVGEPTQIEVQAGAARTFLGNIRKRALQQRNRFACFCVIKLITLLDMTILAIFVANFTIASSSREASCPPCAPCQTLQQLMRTWFDYTSALAVLNSCACSTLPLTLSLWLMMTARDRALMMRPYLQEVPLQPVQAMIERHCLRMGIELRPSAFS